MAEKEYIAKEPKLVKPIPNGAYSGKIVELKYRDTLYRGDTITYADMTLTVDGMPDTTIVASISANELTSNNSWGKFVSQFKTFNVGEKIVPREVLLNKEVSYMVMNVPGTKDPTKIYPQVVKGSIVPKR